MKILHAADLHLGSPFGGFPQDQAQLLRQALRQVPGQLAGLCRQEGCDLVLLAGDLLDGLPAREDLEVLAAALEEMAVPVCVAPGNHDFLAPHSPYITRSWPGNVHIFTAPRLTPLPLPQLDAVVYGAGYDVMDCPPLLEGFQAEGQARWHIGLLHGDPAQTTSPYCPVTAAQVRESALHYLALGHIHRQGSFRAGDTLCAWPGCPMGRGYDECGPKGALIVTLDQTCALRPVVLDGPVFYDLTLPGADPAAALEQALPPADSRDFYRVTFTGEADPIDLAALAAAFPRHPHLALRDRTTPPVDLWSRAGEDSLEGLYFQILRAGLEEDPDRRPVVELAAKISRQLLDGREVALP